MFDNQANMLILDFVSLAEEKESEENRMKTQKEPIDLDTKEGCRTARVCAEEIKAVLDRYSFHSQGTSAGDVVDLFSDIKEHVDDLLSEGLVGSILIAEKVAFAKDLEHQKFTFSRIAELTPRQEYGTD